MDKTIKTFSNIKATLDRLSNITDEENVPVEDKEFLLLWRTYMAIAIIKDFGKEDADAIGSIIDTICAYDEEE